VVLSTTRSATSASVAASAIAVVPLGLQSFAMVANATLGEILNRFPLHPLCGFGNSTGLAGFGMMANGWAVLAFDWEIIRREPDS